VTANDLISRALKTVGVLASGETASSDDVADALTVLNGMVDTWATERLTIYTTARNVFDLSASTQDYTIGTGGTFNIARPQWIVAASIITNKDASSAQKQELPIPNALTVKQWQEVGIKGLTSTFPTQFFYDKKWTAGLATISVWPIPDNSSCQLVLYTPTALTQFADLTTAYTFPPGYEEALRYQLALRLAPEFGVPVVPDIHRIASETFANLKRVNLSLVSEDLSIDAALLAHGGRYDWRNDRYR
jgi:hypothetical protein